jgi:dTDP-4-dehydrorhamnose reductase
LKILITGANGLVGSALKEICAEAGDEVLAFNHTDLDIANAGQVDSVVSQSKPEVIVNCAAWTDVDGCEFDQQKARSVNAEGVANLASASCNSDALFLTISTDYVFDGTKTGFYTQRDNPNPQSVYAKAKLEGEHLAQNRHSRTLVVRTGYVFGPGGRNFLSNVIDLAKSGKKLTAINNCWGTPTYSKHLALRLRELAQLDLPGLFHVVNSGAGVSFEEFTREALRQAGLPDSEVKGVTVESLKRPASRPINSRLKCILSEAIGLAPMPSWKQAIQEFVQQI